MRPIERWWRVVDTRGRTTWLDYDPVPADQIRAAWEGATVHGPYVPEPDERGAVDAIETALAELTGLDGADLDEHERACLEAAVKVLVTHAAGGQ